MLSKYLGGRNFEKDRDRLMIGGGGSAGISYEFVPAIYADESYVGFYGYDHALGQNTQAQGWHVTTPDYTGTNITVYPIIIVPSISNGNTIYVMRCEYSPIDAAGWIYSTTTLATDPFSSYTVTNAPGGYKLPGLALEHNASGLWQVQFYFTRKGADADDTVDDDIITLGWLLHYG